METLLYGCVTWILGQEHFAELRTAHRNLLNLLLRITGFQRRQCTDHLIMSYAKAPNKAHRESVETTDPQTTAPLCGSRTTGDQ